MNEEIRIWWEGPFSYDEVVNNSMDPKIYQNSSMNIGLYQVCGNHILYGTDVLLYIGITTEQNFRTRLKNRWIIDNNNDNKNIKIYLGKIFSNHDNIKLNEKDKILKAEALLVNVLKPALNSSYINSVPNRKINSDDNFTVYNFNNYRFLLPELSTVRWWNAKDLNYELIDNLCKKYNSKIIEDEDFYGFNKASNPNIFIGVDYNYYDLEKVPLVIGIAHDAISESKLKKQFKDFGKDDACFYIEACDNLSDENAQFEIEQKILQIENLLNK
jgi:hypothetical protein